MWIAYTGIARFIFYGGFAVILGMSSAERGGAALWAATHLTGIVAMLIVAAGVTRRNAKAVFCGGMIFLAICTYAWARPMDFLWFGGTQ